MRLGVLVSGRGTNLEAILDAGLSVALVVSNRPGVRALEVAAAHGVPSVVLRRSDYADAAARDAAIGAALAEAGVELAVLAGWDQLLRPVVLRRVRRTHDQRPSEPAARARWAGDDGPRGPSVGPAMPATPRPA